MQETNTERIRKCFWNRLTSLLLEKEIKLVQKQCEYLDVSKSTLMNWKNGACLPSHSELVRISHKLGCSVDFLLDETVTVKTAETDVQTTIKTTGLSEKAIQKLQMCQSLGLTEILRAINTLIVTDIWCFHMNDDGKWTDDNRPDPFNRFTKSDTTGSLVQGNGIIAALLNNLEKSLEYEIEKNKLIEARKKKHDRDEAEKLYWQQRKTDEAQIYLQNSSYVLMLLCTTATGEGQLYHERLKEEFKKWGQDHDSD